MTFTLTIKLGNEAMKSASDVSKALEEVSRRMGTNIEEGKIRDINGNTVGSWKTK
jgi:hypothetical protein